MGRCSYKETYSEGSSIAGQWFNDLVELSGSLKDNAPVRTKLGCHNDENKLFYTQRANGIMGLAPSSDGLHGNNVLQDLFKDKSHVSTEIFSLCLATWGGRLTVGGFDPTNHVPGHRIQWTPMRAARYYFVFPEGLALRPAAGTGEAAIVSSSGNDQFGVTIIDSGTTFTYLPEPVYGQLVKDIQRHCSEHGDCAAVQDSTECWRLDQAALGPASFPTLQMRFQGNASIDWQPQEYLHERGEQGVWCYTFIENNLYQTVLGISWMLHKDVVFDIAQSRLGVAQANCPEHHQESDYLQRNDALQVVLDRFEDVGRRPLQRFLIGGGLLCLAFAGVSWLISAAALVRARGVSPHEVHVARYGDEVAERELRSQPTELEERVEMCQNHRGI